jgi:hypothetical protein
VTLTRLTPTTSSPLAKSTSSPLATSLRKACYLVIFPLAAGFRGRIDGVPYEKVGLVARELLGEKLEVGALINHEKMHSKKIGVVAKDGSLTWFDWWEGPPEAWGFLRLLGRGAKWRFFDRCHRSTAYDEWVKAIKGKSKRTVMGKNWLDSKQVRRLKHELWCEGWVVRKEDRGNRMVLVHADWEEQQWNLEREHRSLEKVDVKVEGAGEVYFLPKVHKPVVTGRCIEAIGRPAGLERLKEVEEYVSRVPWIARRTNDVTRELGERAASVFFSGDIEKLFPSVCFTELASLLAREFGGKLAMKVTSWRVASGVLFRGSFYKGLKGLPIGHPWSPVLANFYLAKKEEGFVRSLEARGHKMMRYVDDTLFIVGKQSRGRGHKLGGRVVKNIKSAYEKAVKPLVVTWEKVGKGLKILDAVVKKAGNDTYRLTYKDKDQWPGGTISKEIHVAILTEKLRRFAEIVATNLTMRLMVHSYCKVGAKHSKQDDAHWCRAYVERQGKAVDKSEVISEWDGTEGMKHPVLVSLVARAAERNGQGVVDLAVKKLKQKTEEVDKVIPVEWVPALEGNKGRKKLYELLKKLANREGWGSFQIRWKYSAVRTPMRLFHR